MKERVGDVGSSLVKLGFSGYATFPFVTLRHPLSATTFSHHPRQLYLDLSVVAIGSALV